MSTSFTICSVLVEVFTVIGVKVVLVGVVIGVGVKERLLLVFLPPWILELIALSPALAPPMIPLATSFPVLRALKIDKPPNARLEADVK